MTIDDLKARGAIYFDNIKLGFDKYDNEIIRMTAEEAGILFYKMWIEAGKSGAYVDFYYYRLKPSEQEQARNVLTDSEQKYLKNQKYQLENISENIIFPLDETLLTIVLKLNESSILFSTIYFLGMDHGGREASTWWGNYHQEYIVFRKGGSNETANKTTGFFTY